MAFIQVLLTNTNTANLREFSREMMSLTDDESCHMVAGGFDFFMEDPLFRHAGLSTVF